MLHSSEASVAHLSENSIPDGVSSDGWPLQEVEALLQYFILKAV